MFHNKELSPKGIEGGFGEVSSGEKSLGILEILITTDRYQ